MLKLSIILPMYNVAPYVERCIRSLEEQDIPKEEYEVICVNDGSPDNCREIVEGLQQEFSNIVLINQENQGVSMARNNGIDRAQGKYLLFIDPDDYVDSNSLARVLKTAKEYKAQVSFLGFTFLNEDGSIRKAVLNEVEQGQVYPGIKAYFVARGDGKTDPDRMVAVLYEREFININGLSYLPDVPYLEDGELIARIMCLAERCIFDGHSFYQRTTRPGSATNSKLFQSEKAGNGFIKAALNLKKFQQEQVISEEQKRFLNQPICKFTLLALKNCMTSIRRFRKQKNLMNFEGIRKCELSGCNNYYFTEGLLYNLSPYLLFIHLKVGSPILRIINP